MIKKTSSKYIKSTVSDDGAMPRSRPGSREGEAARNNHDLSPAEESNVIRLFLTFSSVVVYSDSESGGDAPTSPMSVVNRQLNFSELRALLACQGLAVTDEVFEKLKEDLQLKIPDEISFDEFLAFMSRSQTLRELRTESIAQSKEHVQKFSNRRFQADTVWRWVWDVMVLVTTLYYMLVVPLEWVDRHHDVPQRDLWAWETIASIFFILDMCVFANTVKLDQHGKSVDDLKAVVVFYLKRNFVFDLLGTLPIDLIIEWAYPDTFVTMTAWRVLRSMRVLRLVRIFSLFTGASVNGYLQPAFVYLQYTVGPVLLAIFYFTVLVHILSVTWLGVVLATTPDGLSSAYSNTEKWNYLGALYTVVYTLFTIGYGDMQILGVEQRLFMCFLFIGGALMNGLVISQMSVFLQKANIQNDRQDKMRETLAVLTHFDIPADTQSEILSFQHHLLSHNLGSTHEELMGSLPETIQESLGLFARIKFIALVPMFASSPHDCKEALATRLTNIIFHPNEFIIIAGEVGQEMYFLGHGVADVIGAGGQHFATLRQGAFFGEIALLVEGAARTASIKALTYCDTFRLERNDFDRILAKFPQFRQSMEAEVADRVEKFKESQAKNPPRQARRVRRRTTLRSNAAPLIETFDESRFPGTMEVSVLANNPSAMFGFSSSVHPGPRGAPAERRKAWGNAPESPRVRRHKTSLDTPHGTTPHGTTPHGPTPHGTTPHGKPFHATGFSSEDSHHHSTTSPPSGPAPIPQHKKSLRGPGTSLTSMPPGMTTRYQHDLLAVLQERVQNLERNNQLPVPTVPNARQPSTRTAQPASANVGRATLLPSQMPQIFDASSDDEVQDRGLDPGSIPDVESAPPSRDPRVIEAQQ